MVKIIKLQESYFASFGSAFHRLLSIGKIFGFDVETVTENEINGLYILENFVQRLPLKRKANNIK